MPPQPPSSTHPGPLRILASGTLFYTYALSLPTHPVPGPGANSNVRAHSYVRSRNGSACSVLTVLAQFQTGMMNESTGGAMAGNAGVGGAGGTGIGVGGVEGCWLIASLGGNDEGKEVLRELERVGISAKYCKVWDGVGVPGAWVLHAGECYHLHDSLYQAFASPGTVMDNCWTLRFCLFLDSDICSLGLGLVL